MNTNRLEDIRSEKTRESVARAVKMWGATFAIEKDGWHGQLVVVRYEGFVDRYEDDRCVAHLKAGK